MAFNIGETVGPYRITDRLGQGGMATVFKAYHANLDRYVALKVLHTAFKEDPTFIARFQREAQIIARLEHPSIVPIHDYSEHNGEPYLVMKFIEGETLKSRLSRQPLTLEETLRIMTAVAEALTYAHEQGVLHRDVKPSNVLLDKTGTPYLADFGLARIASAGESTLSQDTMLGTPQYISPEQAQGVRELTGATDVYSLGVVLYELVVGRVPFTADTPYAIVHDHIYTPLPLPSKVNPLVPTAVERVLLKALAKDSADRYPTPVEMVEAFRQAVRDSDLKELSAHSYRVSSSVAAPVAPTAAAIPGMPNMVSASAPGSSPAVGIPAPTMSTPTGMTTSVAARLERQRRRENLWVLGGFALLVLTCLAGMFIALSTYARANELGLFSAPRANNITGQNTAPSESSESSLVVASVDNDTTNSQDDLEIPSVAEAEVAVAADPSNAHAHFTLAAALVNENRIIPAQESFQKGIEHLQGDYTLAMEVAREATKFEKRVGRQIASQWAAFLYSYALVVSQDKDMAVREEAGHYVYTVMQSATNRDLQLLNRLSEAAEESKSSAFIALLALGLNQVGETATVDDLMFQSSFINNDLPEVLLVRGIIYASRNDPRRAKADFEAVIKASDAPAWVVEEAKRLSA